LKIIGQFQDALVALTHVGHRAAVDNLALKDGRRMFMTIGIGIGHHQQRGDAKQQQTPCNRQNQLVSHGVFFSFGCCSLSACPISAIGFTVGGVEGLSFRKAALIEFLGINIARLSCLKGKSC
jgi:hypothetical protein